MTHHAIIIFTSSLIQRITTLHIIIAAALLHFVILGIVDPALEKSKYLPIAGETYNHTGMEGVPQLSHTFITTGQFSHEPGGIPVAYRMPLHYFIFGLSTLLSPSLWPETWTLMATGIFVGVLLMTCKVSSMIGLGENSKKLLIASYGLNPLVLWHARNLASWLTVSFIVITVAWLLLKAIDNQRLKTSIVLGFVIGLGCLSHGSFLLLPLAIGAAILYLSEGKLAVRVGQAVCVIFAAYLTLSPWTLRNYLTFDRFIPSSTGTGFQFWVAEYVYQHPTKLPEGTGTFHLASQVIADRMGKTLAFPYAGILDLQLDEELTKAAKEYLLEHPGRIPRHVLTGLYSFWAPLDNGWKKSLLSAIFNWPVVIVYLCGLLVILFQKKTDFSYRSTIALSTIIFYFWGIFGALQAISSYYITLLPVFYLAVFKMHDALTPFSTMRSSFKKSNPSNSHR